MRDQRFDADREERQVVGLKPAGYLAMDLAENPVDKCRTARRRPCDPSPMRSRLACVREQVQEYLFKITLAAGDFRDVGRHVHVQLDGAAAHPVFQDGESCVDRPPDVPEPLRRAAFRQKVSIPPKMRPQTWSDF